LNVQSAKLEGVLSVKSVNVVTKYRNLTQRIIGLSTTLGSPKTATIEPNASSSLGFMLEPSLFSGMEIQDEVLLGLGMSLPLDSFKGNANWLYRGYTLNYNLR